MTLLRAFSGSKPQSGEDRIGSGLCGLPADPVLDFGQALGGLMDVVAFSDIGERLEQLVEAFLARQGARGRHAGAATRRAHGRQRSIDLSHAPAFPRGIPTRIQTLSAAG
jgi:hypothetical protein